MAFGTAIPLVASNQNPVQTRLSESEMFENIRHDGWVLRLNERYQSLSYLSTIYLSSFCLSVCLSPTPFPSLSPSSSPSLPIYLLAVIPSEYCPHCRLQLANFLHTEKKREL